MFELARLIDDHLPFEDHLGDTIIGCKDGGVFAMFAAAGVSPDTADDVDIGLWFDQLHNAWRNIHDENLEIKIYRCRSGTALPSYDHGETSDFARDLDVDYRQNLVRHGVYQNALFIALHLHSPNTVRNVARFLSETKTDPRSTIKDRADRLDEMCGILQAQLARFGLRRLGYVIRNRVIFDEIVEAIVFATTGVWRQVPSTTGRIGSAMFTEDISFRWRRTIEFTGAGEPYYAAMFTFKNYPTQTWPGMFHDFAVSPYHSTLIYSFRFLSNATADGAINRKHAKMLIGRDKAADQAEELKQAAQEVLGRKWVLGDHSMVLLAFADSRQALTKVANACWRDLAACGLQALRLNTALRAAYLSILPGGARWRPRPGYVSSVNFTAFEPLYNWPVGKDEGWWPGPPFLFRTLAGTLFRFHWHGVGEHPPGNTLVTGTTGSGKTTGCGALIAWTSTVARVVVLDNKQGWRNLIPRLGGDYAVLGAGQAHLAPLKALSNLPEDIDFLTELLRGCIGRMTEEEGRRLALGLSFVMELPPEQRRLSELRAFFDDEPEGAGARLDPWLFGNELGWVIDAPRNTVAFDRVSGFDTTALLDNPRARGPALSFIFYLFTKALDGQPMALFGDEVWRALQDAAFAAQIEKNLRTVRSNNGILVLITQSPGDIVNADISRILTEMCPCQIHGANPRGRHADYVEGLGLTEGQFEALRGLQPGQGLYLLVQDGRGLVVQMPLHGLPQLRVLAAQEVDLRSNVLEFKEAAE